MPPLSALSPGIPARVARVHAEGALLHRMEALGLCSGNLLQVLRRAAFGGPLHLRIGATELLLRRVDAGCVELAVADPS
jgi:ferrous iron transport protein A